MECERERERDKMYIAEAVIISSVGLCIGRMCLLADGTGFIA